MNRRHFLYGAGLAGAALLGGGGLFFARQVDCMGLAYSDLPKNIRALYHEDFVDAFPDTTLEEIVRELRDLGVCTWRGFSIERVRSNAADDPLVEFNDMFWTKSELLMYAVVARLSVAEDPSLLKEIKRVNNPVIRAVFDVYLLENRQAMHRLPDYPVAKIHTGQFTGEDRLWEGAIFVAEPGSDGRPSP